MEISTRKVGKYLLVSYEFSENEGENLPPFELMFDKKEALELKDQLQVVIDNLNKFIES